MTTREAYIEKVMGQINAWKADYDKLKAEAQQASGDAKLEHKEDIEKLGQRISSAEKKLDQIKKAGEDSWEDLKVDAEEAWKDMSDAIDTIKKKF